MKKYALLFSIILCTGCFNNQILTCTKSNSDNGFSMNEEVRFEIKNKTVNNLDMNLNFVLDNNYLNHVDVINSNIDEIINVYDNEEGIQVSTMEEENSIVVGVKADYSQIGEPMQNDTLNIYKYKDSNLTIDELKAQMETNLYSCIISDK